MQKIIVSLTSYPERIGIVNKVIESLFRQSILADEIILYLSTREFPYKEKELPIVLVEMIGKKGFRIEWVEANLKSHKKYYYVLQEKQEDIVITVDDDVVYAETLISDLLRSFQKFPQAVSARRTRIVLRDSEQLLQYRDWDDYLDEYMNMPRMDLCAIGVGGILYPPHCASDRWFDETKVRRMAENQDDLWIKFNEIIDSYPVVYIKPADKDILIEDLSENNLSVNNVLGKGNEICIKKLSAWIKSDYPEIYYKWFQSLLLREVYISNKKHFWCNLVKMAFDEVAHMPVYLYGAGKKAKCILKMLYDFGLIDKLDAIIVSNKRENPDELETVEVKPIEDIDKNVQFGVICGVKDDYKYEIENMLKEYNYKFLNLNFRGIMKYYNDDGN